MADIHRPNQAPGIRDELSSDEVSSWLSGFLFAIFDSLRYPAAMDSRTLGSYLAWLVDEQVDDPFSCRVTLAAAGIRPTNDVVEVIVRCVCQKVPQQKLNSALRVALAERPWLSESAFAREMLDGVATDA